MTKLMIIGAGGHGRVVADCAQAMGRFEEIVFADASYPNREFNSHWPIAAQDIAWQKYLNQYEFIVAIGDNHARLTMSEEIRAAGGQLASLIHPAAVVSPYANIGDGSVIFANAVVSVNCHLGLATIVNHNATIDHDCKLDDACHIAPGTNISGGVTLGHKVWAGVGSTIIQNRQLADNVYLGAGTVVIKDIEQAGTYVGNPARKL